MTTFIAPERVAAMVRRRLEESACDVSAYWMRVAAERETYAAALIDELDDDPVVVAVIRDASFTNPNAVLDDFVALMTRYREACEERFVGRPTKCAFVLLSRVELAIAQISSPVMRPEWFPIGGGTSMSMLIEDLTWTADAPIAAPESKIGDLCEHLLDLEEALLVRIAAVKKIDHRKTSGFGELIRRQENEKLDEILVSATEHRLGVTTPSAFRPSLRDGRSLSARLWSVSQSRKTEDLNTPSRLLADALALPEKIELAWHEAIPSILRRPSGGEPDVAVRFARNVLLTIGTTCQLVTAAAHSDDYALYPIVLLRSLSFDLRRSLGDAETVVRALGVEVSMGDRGDRGERRSGSSPIE